MKNIIDDLCEKAILTENNLEANEYLRIAKNEIYKQECLSNLEKMDYLYMIDNIAKQKRLPT